MYPPNLGPTRRPIYHTIKSHPEPFKAVIEGRKRFEFRKDDRDYRVGDVLHMEEFDPEAGQRSGRWIRAEVTYITRSATFGIPEGYCAMSIVNRDDSEADRIAVACWQALKKEFAETGRMAEEGGSE